MEIRKVNDAFSVTGQINTDALPQIVSAGFKSLVCNRPDTEDGAVPHDQIEAAAKAAGLEFRFLPVVSSNITDQDVREMAALLETLPQPVLAYCRSGGRCMNLYALTQNLEA